MDRSFDITVRSDTNYEELIAEIVFRDKAIGVIVSQENARDQFEIRVHSLIERSRERFFATEKIEEISIDLSEFLSAVEAAKQRLLLLDVPR